MNISVAAQIKCPFYISETTNLICCEGFIKSTCMTTRFPDRETKMAHVRKYCFSETGGKCPLATNLYAKYLANEEKEDRAKKLKAKALNKAL